MFWLWFTLILYIYIYNTSLLFLVDFESWTSLWHHQSPLSRFFSNIWDALIHLHSEFVFQAALSPWDTAAMAQLVPKKSLSEDVTELNMSQNAMAEFLDVFECSVHFCGVSGCWNILSVWNKRKYVCRHVTSSTCAQICRIWMYMINI